MGFLEDAGKTLAWDDSKKYHDGVKTDGVKQFVNLLQKFQNYSLRDMHSKISQNNYNKKLKILYWGDEIESHIVYNDPKKENIQI